jgi:hypothetical protein
MHRKIYFHICTFDHSHSEGNIGNRVQRRIFEPKRNEVPREWRILHTKELYFHYSSPNTLRVIKSRRIKWTGHVARMGERRSVYRF